MSLYLISVYSEEDIKRLISRKIDEYGRLDILVNNAGVAYKWKLENTALEEYNKIMDTNLKGVFSAQNIPFPILEEAKMER